MKKCAACSTETNLMGSLGGVLLCQSCRGQIEIDIADARANDQPVDVTVMARRMYNRLHDNTRTQRWNKRNEALNAKAQELGFDSLSQLLTSWKNGDIEIEIRRKQQ